MGALTAFLGGAAGNGLVDLTRKWDRNAEIQEQRAFREKELEEQRRFQLERDQQTGFGARGRRSGGGGGDDGGDPMESRRQAAAFELMQREKIPMAQALSLVDASISGENPLTRRTQRSESIDDGDRQRNVTTEASEPDIERFKQIVAQVGRAFSNADSNAKSNSAQRAEGRQTDAVTEAAQSGNPAQERGALLMQGKAPFDAGGSNVLSGVPAAGSLDAARVGTEGTKQMSDRAQAGKYVADANKLKADVAGDLKSQTPERLTTTLNAINGLIRTYDENSMDDAAKAARAELQGMAREIANELKRKGLSPGALPAAKPGEPKPAEAPKPAAKMEPAPRDPAQRKAGVVYDTPRGPLKWTGTGWVKG